MLSSSMTSSLCTVDDRTTAIGTQLMVPAAVHEYVGGVDFVPWALYTTECQRDPRVRRGQCAIRGKSSESVRGIGEHLEEGGGRIERPETSGGRQ
jgi:hypothetical protein